MPLCDSQSTNQGVTTAEKLRYTRSQYKPKTQIISAKYHNWCFWQDAMQLALERWSDLHSRQEVVETFCLKAQAT